MKLVSVIIPAYNSAKFIKEALDSILAQTYPNIELVIVNDGSTDNTEEVVRPYLADKKIIYIKQENDGIAQARNNGVAHSYGEYIALLDSDDVAFSERISEQVDFLERHPNYGIVYSGFRSFFEGSLDKPLDVTRGKQKLFSYKRIGYSGNILEPLLKHSFICPSTVMMRKEAFNAVGGFDNNFRDAEDWDLWRRLAYRGILFGYIDKPLVYTRLRVNSLSGFHNQVRMKKMSLISFEKMFQQMKPRERVQYGAEKILKTLKFKLAIAHLLLGEKKEFRHWLKESGKWHRPLIYPLSWLPGKLISFLIKKTWLWRQSKLFRRAV